MVIWSDNIQEYLAGLDAKDHLSNAGTIYYLKELSDENATYPAGEGVNLLARIGDAVAVINGMSLEIECPSVEIWLFGDNGQDMTDLVNCLFHKYAGVSCEFHCFNQDVVDFLEQKGAETYDETLEYVGHGLKFNQADDILKLTEEHFEVLAQSEVEDIAMYCGELPLSEGNYAVYGKMECDSPITICTLEFNHNGFADLVEPIWVYTSTNCRRNGLAKRCIGHALSNVDENVLVMYHMESENQSSIKLAESLGLIFNNKCVSLAVDL